MILPLEKQVTSLELSKRLKELGVKQESYFYWIQQVNERSEPGDAASALRAGRAQLVAETGLGRAEIYAADGVGDGPAFDLSAARLSEARDLPPGWSWTVFSHSARFLPAAATERAHADMINSVRTSARGSLSPEELSESRCPVPSSPRPSSRGPLAVQPTAALAAVRVDPGSACGGPGRRKKGTGFLQRSPTGEGRVSVSGFGLMHLLVTHSGTIEDGTEPRDLGQTPGDIVVISSADTELSLLARAHGALAAGSPQPSLRLVNLMQLKHNFSVDLYAEKTLTGARLVVLRLLGGRSYWPYGLERLTDMASGGAFELIVMPGDDKPDPMLAGLSTVSDATREQIWAYLREGGADNAALFLGALAALLHEGELPPPARPLLKAGLYWPGIVQPALTDLRRQWSEGNPVAAVVFYRALLQSGDLAAVDALIESLAACGLNPLPVYVTSLREEVCLETLAALFRLAPPDIVLNSTAFAASVGPAGSRLTPPFAGLDAMVLQLVFSGESEERWAGGTRGLSPHYIAMHVALPEVDGRVLTRAVSFKADSAFDAATQHYLTRSEPKPDRVDFVGRLAAAWTTLRRTPASERKLGLILANYPNRDSRLANGVGLDTPQSAVEILRALDGAGYEVGSIPDDGNALIAALREGPTNAGLGHRQITERLNLDDYLAGSTCCRNRFAMPSPHAGVRRKTILSSPKTRLPFRRFVSATSPSASSRRAATISIRKAPITIPIWCRRIATSPFTSGCGKWRASTPSSISASTAIWNGCRGRRWRSPRPATRRPRWARCRTSIRSSSTIRARAARRNGAPPLSSSTI